MTKKYKIYKRTVHEDRGITVTFGTDEDVKDWKQEEQEWIEQNLCVDEDTIEQLIITSTDPNIGKILNVINDNINELKGKVMTKKYTVQYDHIEKHFNDLSKAYEFAELQGMEGYDITIYDNTRENRKIIAEDWRER